MIAKKIFRCNNNVRVQNYETNLITMKEPLKGPLFLQACQLWKDEELDHLCLMLMAGYLHLSLVNRSLGSQCDW